MAEKFGRYTLLKRLGAGGMGEVFLARPHGSEGTDHFIVVKTLLPALAEDEDLVRMFLEEAKLAAQLDHPNVCRVLDLGIEDGILFMALEFIRGVDLERLGKQAEKVKNPVPVPIACRIVIDAARGLHHAHELTEDGVVVGLVHRDVSPHNLLCTYDGKVKVIDFGLAKTVGKAQQSHTGSLKGKFAYMSPEMVRAERIDRRADVFALGIILHELIVGERLFRKDNDVATLAAIAQCEVPTPSSKNRRVPPDLDEVVMKALAKDRPKRYQSAAELADALEALLGKYGGGQKQSLGSYMRELYKEQLDEEAKKGILHDAPDGPVMKMRGYGTPGNLSKLFEGAAAPAPPAPPPPPAFDSSELPTDKAALDEQGVPVRPGGVRLAPRPEAVGPSRLAAVAPPRPSPVKRLPPPVEPDDETEPEERTLPLGADSPFDRMRREALRLSADSEPPAGKPSALARKGAPIAAIGDDEQTETTSPGDGPTRPNAKPSPKTVPLAPAYTPQSSKPAQKAPVGGTVPLAPAYVSPEPAPVAPPSGGRGWVGLGIGLAVAVVTVAILVLFML